MAKPVSEEELQLQKRARRRLIGAIVLVAAIAAVLPMVLDSEPKATSQEVNIQIPSPDSKGGFSTKAVPAPGAKAAAKSDVKSDVKEPAAPLAAEAKDAASASDSKPAADKPPAKAAEKAADKSAEKTAEKAAVKAPEKAAEKAPEKAPEKSAVLKPGPGTFFIQVTALADTEKVKQVQQQITETGLRSYTEVVAAGAGKVTRVRAGPFATRDEAEQARAKLATAGLEGKVAAQ